MGYKITQGEDVLISIPIIDNNNNPIDLSGALKVRVALIVKNLIVYRYMDKILEAPIAGYGTLTILNTTGEINNVILLSLLRNESSTFPIGDMTASILIEFPDADLLVKRVEYSYSIGTILKGQLKDENLTI